MKKRSREDRTCRVDILTRRAVRLEKSCCAGAARGREAGLAGCRSVHVAGRGKRNRAVDTDVRCGESCQWVSREGEEETHKSC